MILYRLLINIILGKECATIGFMDEDEAKISILCTVNCVSFNVNTIHAYDCLAGGMC